MCVSSSPCCEESNIFEGRQRNTMGNIGWELARKQNSSVRTTGNRVDSLTFQGDRYLVQTALCSLSTTYLWWCWHNKPKLEQYSLLTMKKSGGEKRRDDRTSYEKCCSVMRPLVTIMARLFSCHRQHSASAQTVRYWLSRSAAQLHKLLCKQQELEMSGVKLW